MMASSSGVPPGSLSAAEYDPQTYVHDDPEGPRRKTHWDSPIDGDNPNRDWNVLTIGFDNDNRTADEASVVQVPLGEVLIGMRCNEDLRLNDEGDGCSPQSFF